MRFLGGFKGTETSVTLYMCYTGKMRVDKKGNLIGSFAQELADELGIPVTAPTGRIKVWDDGSVTLEDDHVTPLKDNKWETYYPEKKNHQTKVKICNGVGGNDQC